jgi:hypothetical protein
LRLNSYSGTPRALSAPGEVAVWPTSIRTRNVERVQLALSLASCVAVSPARSGCQTVPATITARATIRINESSLTTMDQTFAGVFIAAINRRFLRNHPKPLYLFVCCRTKKICLAGAWTRRKFQSKPLFAREGSQDDFCPFAAQSELCLTGTSCLWRQPCSHRALISLNFANARSNTPLKSHIASRISRMVAEVRERSTCPNVKILLLRKYRITIGSDTL